MTVDHEGVARLIDLAKVPADKKVEAERLLTAILSPMPLGKSRLRSVYDAGEQIPVPKKHNPPLKRIESAAKELRKALAALNGRPHLDFWTNEEGLFGPDGGLERQFMRTLEEALERIERAARGAVIKRDHRPRRQGKRHIARRARRFFERYSPLEPGNGGVFEEFCEKLLSLALGGAEVTGMSGAIKDVLREPSSNRP